MHSMTAFAHLQYEDTWGNATIEIRSVNHRYLDMQIEGTDEIQGLEELIREHMSQVIKRGKVSCNIRYSLHAQNTPVMKINQKLAEALCTASKKIIHLLPPSTVFFSPTDILRWPGIVETQTPDKNFLKNTLLNLVQQGTALFIENRSREGLALKALFLQRLSALRAALATISQQAPIILAAQQNRLKKQFLENKIELEPARLAQEMIFFSNKIDILEEIERIETHCIEFERTMEKNGSRGRHLDFLLQEIFRETNTLSAKSNDTNTVHLAVEMKVLIEQMREQVQNIE